MTATVETVRVPLVTKTELPSEALTFFGGESQRMVATSWHKKYALKDPNGKLLEVAPPQSFARYCKALGVSPSSPEGRAIHERRFVFAGRIMFALGNPHHRATLKNCFVLPIKEDSIGGIFGFCHEAAKTYSYGGGVGTSITPLRPRNSPVNNCAIVSSGSVSFMDLFSTVTGTMGQAGRRGALMLMISVEHPDIEEFIGIKSDVDAEWLAAAARTGERDGYGKTKFAKWVDDRRKVRYANVSVQLTDRFMEAVEKGKDIELRYESPKVSVKRMVNAAVLWDKIMTQAWESAEPGVVFWDEIKRESASDYYGPLVSVTATNPCAEMPLAPYDSCNLGHVNLAKLVIDSFKASARVAWELLEDTVRCGVRMLDKLNTIEDEENRYPLPEMKAANLGLRRIGLGFMGLGEMFIRLGVVYGSDDSIKLAERITEHIQIWSYDESCNLAERLGPFGLYDYEKHKLVPSFQRLPEALREKIKLHGLRNVTCNTVAPTGSVAMFAQTTSGIEPLYALTYDRRVDNGSLEAETFRYAEPIVVEWARATGVDLVQEEGRFRLPVGCELPPYMVSAYNIDWVKRVELQAAVQRHIDQSISSTVNLPASATVEDVKKIYMAAWKLKCKGITVYRKGSRDEILSDVEPKPAVVVPERSVLTPQAQTSSSYELPDVLDGKRIAFRDGDGNRVLINIGFDPQNARPMEIVITHSKTNPDLGSLSQALGIMTSIALQEGIPAERVARAVRGIKSGWVARVKVHPKDRPLMISSVPDAIAVALMRYANLAHPAFDGADAQGWVEIDNAEICPHCKRRALVYENGCHSCRNCAASKCIG